MTVTYDTSHRGGWPVTSQSALCLEDKFEVIKDIGDGSFGSVSLGRTRSAGAQVVRRGTMVCYGARFIVCRDLTVRRLPSRP